MQVSATSTETVAPIGSPSTATTGPQSLVVVVNANLFDFNSGSTAYPPTQTNYTPVNDTTLFSSNPQGFGWQSTAGISSFDRGPLTGNQADVRRDVNYGLPGVTGTFSVLTGNGTFFVNVTVGDLLLARDLIQFNAEGGAIEVPSLSTLGNHWTHAGFTVTVTDGQLDIAISDLGGNDASWIVNAIEIRPAASVQQISISGPTGSLPADGSVDLYTGNGAVPNSLLTVTTTLGNLSGNIDADPNYDGVQVQADGNGSFTFNVKRPNLNDTPETGNNTNPEAFNVLAIDGSRQGNLSLTYTAKSHVLNKNLTVGNATGNEDTAIPLSISSQLNDLDGSETLSITIGNVPIGATLSAGNNTGGGVWTLTPAQLGNLTITPPLHDEDNMLLTVTATFTDSTIAPFDTQILTGNITVLVRAVADVPTLNVGNSTGNQGTAIPLNISGNLIDTDGSETLKYIITGVPAGATLNAGFESPAGTWTLEAGDVTGLTITPNVNSSTSFSLNVVAQAIEGENFGDIDGPTPAVATANSTIQTINVTIVPTTQLHFDFNAGAGNSGLNTAGGYIGVGRRQPVQRHLGLWLDEPGDDRGPRFARRPAPRLP